MKSSAQRKKTREEKAQIKATAQTKRLKLDMLKKQVSKLKKENEKYREESGTQKVGDPTVTFDEFNFANEDDLGWWHVSCSYSFQKTIQATLYNENDVDVMV